MIIIFKYVSLLLVCFDIYHYYMRTHMFETFTHFQEYLEVLKYLYTYIYWFCVREGGAVLPINE